MMIDDSTTKMDILPNSEKEAKKLSKQLAKKAKFEEKERKRLEDNKTKASASKDVPAKQKGKKAKDKLTYDIEIPTGDKKDVSGEMPTAYSPRYVEAAWYAWWEKSGFFKPEYGGRDLTKVDPANQFTIVIPPPSVTGTLHLGHALATSVEDSLARWHRMRGDVTLFNPGCDHAGIATQVVVEKKLWRERQLTRHDIGRERFVDQVWKWKNEKGDYIYDQLRRLGSSVDWGRACYTMDPKMSEAVKEAFITLHERGLIYRSTRLVNWSCTLRSAISDIEVDKKELSGRTLLAVPGYDHKVEFGVLISFAYPIVDSDEEVVVATTRVETMLGDTAVAVHPSDERFGHLIGRLCRHPFVDRALPIIADSFVDRDFGTGAVKITPAHDQNDYETAMRHQLPSISCIDADGLMTNACGRFAGMKRFDARRAVLRALAEVGLYRGTRDNPGMTVPICSRSKDVVEPLLKAQWYVKSTEMARRAVEAVSSGELRLMPEFHVRTWNSWMENIRDWCISRQLWWGHRIPAYFVTVNDPAAKNGDSADDDFWVCGRTQDEAFEKAAEKFAVSREQISLTWDDDVLDTWFSAALFPFSIFGWPQQTADLKCFYPGHVLETGHDILFFWVARMVFLGQELTGELPFTDVFLHAMVRDAHGRKMSKSLGNIVDPLDVIGGISLGQLQRQLELGNLDEAELKRAREGQKRDYPDGIPECGTDALRFALCAYLTQGRDINLDVLRVQGYRHFCNKIWQAVRFTLMHLGQDFQPRGGVYEESGDKTLMDCWVLSRLATAVGECNFGFGEFNLPRATTACFNFWLYDFCDVYLEALKPLMADDAEAVKSKARDTLYTCVETALRLVSPFMPYLSEELWQRLPRRANDAPSICVAAYPITAELEMFVDAHLEGRVQSSMAVVKTVRSVRADYELTAKTRAELFVCCADAALAESLKELKDLILTLTNSKSVEILSGTGVENLPTKNCAIVTVSSTCKVHLLLQGILDMEKEAKKLVGRIEKLESQIQKLTDASAKPDYQSKVPEDVRRGNDEKKEILCVEVRHLCDALDAIQP